MRYGLFDARTRHGNVSGFAALQAEAKRCLSQSWVLKIAP